MNPAIPVARICALCLLLVFASAARRAEADYTGFGAPRISLVAGAQPEFLRAMSLCSVADSSLPVQYDLRVQDPGDTGARLVMEVSPGPVAPPGLRLFRGDIAATTVLEQTPTRIVVRGFAFDITQLLRTSAVLANGPGTAVYTATYCNEIGVCGQMRARIEFVGPTSSIKTAFCDPPPVLRAEDDNGLRGDDDYTSAQPLRFEVDSPGPSVTLLRDGVPIDTRSVVGGSATLQDSSAPTVALHAYQVVHVSGVPSAARFVERHPASVALFGNGFESLH